ncbi:DNA gyrase/topoisomerase IV subunit A [Porphyromonas asaccharolytica]|uniref:DNA gyrase/topoisomerase IV subunit A n=1 Tax=Porphyromonas asaccharolytica TaxID=28123 RepID=UPI00248F0B1B|nr:DNA gyrase/topoisomerase IV subunit A [Porphyromonas asaccharolytica]
MDQDNHDIEQEQEMEETTPTDIEAASTSADPSDEGYVAPEEDEGDGHLHTLGGMYRHWFLDYASYVILERAVPHIEDGLKPVQRRVLYTMHLMENGTLHKVAKIVGATMAYHPHGDASINDALVQLGQKGYLIDTQGNWGNILTGDEAAAGRYIEAKLSNFALEILFGDKITPWMKSYDGKSREPVYLPARFPLLLAQGAEGIAVGLSCKILPHNPKELIEAACAYLRGEPFTLYPDFPTGGIIDVDRYNDGKRGGQVKSRARIERIEDRVLSVRDLPFGKTTSTLIDSILKANDKGLIKIKRIDDMTAETADIRIYLPVGVSADKTIDGLYAFTDCEVSISPNACVIEDDKPRFLGVSDLLRHSVKHTRELLQEDLRLQLHDRQEEYMGASLERLFIEHRIYKLRPFEEAPDQQTALDVIRKALEPIVGDSLLRSITDDDLARLLEIKMARILKFNLEKNEQLILRLTEEMAQIQHHLDHITDYTIHYYSSLLEEYGAGWERRTQIGHFGTIEATKVVEENLKLYIDRKMGFAGTGIKGGEYVCDCSEIDDMIVFFRDGTYLITKIEEKKFLGKERVLHINKYVRGDKRTIYNAIYLDGKTKTSFIKRFHVSASIRDRGYNLTMGTPGSKVLYFSANPNGEAESVMVKLLRGATSRRILVFEKDFADIAIKGRSAKGNIVTRAPIERITLKEQGGSTLGGRKVWFDPDVNRINYNDQGNYLGEFESSDRILVILPSEQAYTTDFGESNHFSESPKVIEKYDPDKVWSVIYTTPEGVTYIKRVSMPDSKRPQAIIDPEEQLLALTDEAEAQFTLITKPQGRKKAATIEISVTEYEPLKKISARGKRITALPIDSFEKVESVADETEEEEEELTDE